MVVRVDGTTVGIVSGGCLESDLAEHARRVQATGIAEVVTYDTRTDDEAVWGLGLGCNGLIDVLLEPLNASAAGEVASLLDLALISDEMSVLATIIQNTGSADAPVVGAHALMTCGQIRTTGRWGEGPSIEQVKSGFCEAISTGRHGLVREYGDILIAFEVVAPAVQLIICGGGPDVVPLVRLAINLGWDATVVDHRAVMPEHRERFPGARVAECAYPVRLAETVSLGRRAAAVVMSHNFSRDTDYVSSLLRSDVSYIGVLGPRSRTERMLSEIAARTGENTVPDGRLFGPVGLDIGGEGPEAIALSIAAQIAAVTADRSAGHLRDRKAPLHSILSSSQ